MWTTREASQRREKVKARGGGHRVLQAAFSLGPSPSGIPRMGRSLEIEQTTNRHPSSSCKKLVRPTANYLDIDCSILYPGGPPQSINAVKGRTIPGSAWCLASPFPYWLAALLMPSVFLTPQGPQHTQPLPWLPVGPPFSLSAHSRSLSAL